MAIPNARDLLAAVRHFLEADVQPELKGRKAFHAKVAANVLATLERELTVQPLETERQVLAGLLGAGKSLKAMRTDLAEAIRSGRMTETTPGLLDALERITLARLAADNPGYSTYRRLSAGS
jgi:hypothetical protein